MRWTWRARRFVDEYCVDFIGAAAARRAGYSAKTCYEIAHQLLQKPEILEAIQRRFHELSMQAGEVTYRLTQHARASIGTFTRVNDDGLLEFDFSSDEAQANLHLIKKVRTKRKIEVVGSGEEKENWEHEETDLELHDSQKALELLGKHHQLFAERLKVEGGLRVEGIQDLLDLVYGKEKAKSGTGSHPGK